MEKKEIIRNAPVIEFDKDTSIVTYVKSETEGEKNGIVFAIPQDDEEAKERYNCDLAYLLAYGVRNIAGNVKYEGDHAAMQAAADAYKIGVRGTGKGRKTIKKVEAERDAALAIALQMGEASGMSEEAIKKMVEDYSVAQASDEGTADDATGNVADEALSEY